MKENINPRLLDMGISPTLASKQKCKELQEQGKEVYKLGLGESPFPIPNSIVEALKDNAKENRYLPVKGLQELREAVAEFHRRRDQIEVDPDNILIGPGTKELLFILQLVFDGEILLPSPYWVSYESESKILGKNFHQIHTKFSDRWTLTPELLSKKAEQLKDKNLLMILNYPGNPSGTTYTEEQLKKIAETARKHDIIILSDEIYGLINHKGEHVSISKFYPEGTIISSGLSKWCSGGGWRLGTFVFPQQLSWIMKAMCTVGSETFSSVSSPVQYAAITAFKGNQEIENYLKHTRRIYSRLGKECSGKLSSAGIKVNQPEGGFYLFIDFSDLKKNLESKGINNSKELCTKILEETGVAILPGSVFGRPEEEFTARLAYVDFDGTKALKESYNISLDQELPTDFTKQFCGKVLTAIDKIIEWLQ